MLIAAAGVLHVKSAAKEQFEEQGIWYCLNKPRQTFCRKCWLLLQPSWRNRPSPEYEADTAYPGAPQLA